MPPTPSPVSNSARTPDEDLGTLTFEDATQELDRVVARMGSPDVGLDDALGLFQRGVQLLERASAALNRAEASLQQLTQSADGSLTLVALSEPNVGP